MSANCDVLVIFPIYGQFGALQKSDFGCIVFKTYTFIIATFCLKKTEPINL